MSALAYVIGDARGESDSLLAALAARLEAEGWPLAGVVQTNTPRDCQRHCDMDLRVLGRAETVRISQSLGSGSSGCRLDPEGLATAVALVEARLAARPRLLILNKFGKAELEGRGFRALIGAALEQGIPVLLGLNRLNQPGFEAFAEGLAEPLAADPDALVDWCRTRAAVAI